MKDIIKLANGEDDQFNSLLDEYFGIKFISAQIIVTTHSPNMITDDYEKIIRMYKMNSQTFAVTGQGLQLHTSERKQLLMQFEYIKEAVFARGAIIVEGDSEYGAFPRFAEKLGIDFDKSGIALLKAGGAESIIPMIKLLNKLGIKAVGVIDNDKKVEKSIPDEEFLFFTKSKCFDSEIVKRIFQNHNYDVAKNILIEYDSHGMNRFIRKQKLDTIVKKYDYKNVLIEGNYYFCDIDETSKLAEVMFVAWFEINKGILLGKTIGELLTKKDIPPCYIKAIRKAEKYAREC